MNCSSGTEDAVLEVRTAAWQAGTAPRDLSPQMETRQSGGYVIPPCILPWDCIIHCTLYFTPPPTPASFSLLAFHACFQTLLQQHIINLTLQCFAMTRPKATSKLKWPDSKRNKSYSNVIRVFKMWWTGAFPLPTSLQTHSTLWWLLDFFPFPSLH